MIVTKAISLHQPWATLFVAGAKLIETRAWQSGFKGPLAVHAAKTVDLEACSRPEFREALEAIGCKGPTDLPMGALLGVVDLVDCLRMVSTLGIPGLSGVPLISAPGSILLDDPRLTNTERAFGHYAPGRFAWITGDQHLVLAKPIPLRGFQRIWNLPPAVTQQLAAAFEGEFAR